MAFAKYARSEVLEVKHSARPLGTLTKFASATDDDYISDEGYLYVRVRAISSRVNKNYDGWPSDVLKQSYATFMHRPVFVEHNNDNPLRARGVIVDAQLHIEDAKTASEADPYYKTAADNHKPPTWVELLLEIDAESFPKLAKAIVDGDIDGFSMGANVEKTSCSVCGNVASDVHEFCDHVQHKGAYYDSHDDSGNRTSKLAYEDCDGVSFFEISAVFDPADETALTLGLGKNEVREAVVKEAEADEPRVDKTTAPKKVDTLRQEDICPVCGGTMTAGECGTCRYQVPPEGLDNPDLEKAKKVDKKLEEQRTLNELKKRKQERGPENRPNPNDVKGEGMVAAKVASRSENPKERPMLPTTNPRTDQPKDTKVVQDSLKPVESNTMDKQAGEPHGGADTKPDANVDVEAIGGAMPLKEPGSESVEKKVEVKGDHTDTWGVDEGNTLGQADPVGGDAFPNKESKMDKEALEVMNDKPTKMDLEGDLAEEVGPPTTTFGEGEGNSAGQADPVTSEEGVGGGPIGESATTSSHVFAAMKVAELMTELGMIPADEKFERAAALEGETPQAIEARLETLASVKTAGLKRTAATKRVAGRVPSMRPASQTGKTAGKTPGMDNIDDSQIFLG